MSHATESMFKACFPMRLLVLVATLGGVWSVPNRATAQDELRKAQSEAGRVWYDKYCTPCHGNVGTPGSAVYPDSKQAVDLRTYVQRHGGQFPAGEWIMIVTGSPHSAVHSEAWEKIRKQHQTSGTSGHAEARGIVASIAEFVISVQTKQE